MGDALDLLQILHLPPAAQHIFQFIGDVEVVLDGLFTPARHQNEVLHAGANGLLDHVLDDRGIH
ncbi:hypothetical protein GALL_495590 [mine drainage metagenome]|uniref:Uncharacterized protein n=1 Tax=mine drainage metagenome TaxID=410659 RepID=A0A1J5PU79_9ZZZZ